MRENYSEYMVNKYGKTKWQCGAERKLFANDVESAKALIKEKPSDISLFSVPYLYEHQDMIETFIKKIMDAARYHEDYSGKLLWNLVPADLLKNQYSLFLYYVEHDGLLLDMVPEEVQNAYLMIPREAVRENPEAVRYATFNALMSYPDIALDAVKKNPNLVYEIPIVFLDEHPEVYKASGIEI